MEKQTVILEKSVAATQSSADAAKTSADIAVGVALPTFAIQEFEAANAGTVTAEKFFQSPRMKITIKNYGQTPAFLRFFSLCFSCEDLPEIPVYDGPGSGIVLEKIVVQPGELYTLPVLEYFRTRAFPSEEVEAIVKHEKPFTAYGYICYSDIFGNPLWRFKFCETVLNIDCGEQVCDWWGGFASSAYCGTDHFTGGNPKQEQENPQETQ